MGEDPWVVVPLSWVEGGAAREWRDLGAGVHSWWFLADCDLKEVERYSGGRCWLRECLRVGDWRPA